MYRVIFYSVNNGWNLSDDFSNIEKAREYKDRLIKAHYQEDKIHIITIVEQELIYFLEKIRKEFFVYGFKQRNN